MPANHECNHGDVITEEVADQFQLICVNRNKFPETVKHGWASKYPECAKFQYYECNHCGARSECRTVEDSPSKIGTTLFGGGVTLELENLIFS